MNPRWDLDTFSLILIAQESDHECVTCNLCYSDQLWITDCNHPAGCVVVICWLCVYTAYREINPFVWKTSCQIKYSSSHGVWLFFAALQVPRGHGVRQGHDCQTVQRGAASSVERAVQAWARHRQVRRVGQQRLTAFILRGKSRCVQNGLFICVCVCG